MRHKLQLFQNSVELETKEGKGKENMSGLLNSPLENGLLAATVVAVAEPSDENQSESGTKDKDPCLPETKDKQDKDPCLPGTKDKDPGLPGIKDKQDRDSCLPECKDSEHQSINEDVAKRELFKILKYMLRLVLRIRYFFKHMILIPYDFAVPNAVKSTEINPKILFLGIR